MSLASNTSSTKQNESAMSLSSQSWERERITLNTVGEQEHISASCLDDDDRGEDADAATFARRTSAIEERQFFPMVYY